MDKDANNNNNKKLESDELFLHHSCNIYFPLHRYSLLELVTGSFGSLKNEKCKARYPAVAVFARIHYSKIPVCGKVKCPQLLLSKPIKDAVLPRERI